MESVQAAILQRLAGGEPPDAILSSLRPLGEREALRRCAVVRTFDRKLFDEVLAPEESDADWLKFDDFVQAAEVEPVPRRPGIYRLRPDARSINWKAWWSDSRPPPPETELPETLHPLVSRLIDYYAKTDRPLDLLAQLALSDHEAAVLFSHLYREADERFDLAFCQDLIDVLSVEERSPVFGPQAHGPPEPRKSAADSDCRDIRRPAPGPTRQQWAYRASVRRVPSPVPMTCSSDKIPDSDRWASTILN